MASAKFENQASGSLFPRPWCLEVGPHQCGEFEKRGECGNQSVEVPRNCGCREKASCVAELACGENTGKADESAELVATFLVELRFALEVYVFQLIPP